MAQPSSSVRTDCPSCGTVDISIDDAHLVLGFDRPHAQHVLRYTCPTCGIERTQPTNERATRLLMAAGIGLLGSPSTSPAAPEGPASRSSG